MYIIFFFYISLVIVLCIRKCLKMMENIFFVQIFTVYIVFKKHIDSTFQNFLDIISRYSVHKNPHYADKPITVVNRTK